MVKSAPKAAAWPKKHKIAEGDTLLAIADLYYGDGRMVSAILKANPRIKDPRALRIGDEITLEAPPASAKPAAGPAVAGAPARPGEAAKPAEPPKPAESASPPAEKTYQVREGDSFYSIAQSQLGSGGRWAELFRLNRELVKGDAKRLRPGMVLRLPVN